MLFFKKLKLEKQLIDEIKRIAKVDEFPHQDGQIIADLLVAYKKGNPYVMIEMMKAIDTLDKYPDLVAKWDQLMIKYKSLGLFPKWNIRPL